MQLFIPMIYLFQWDIYPNKLFIPLSYLSHWAIYSNELFIPMNYLSQWTIYPNELFIPMYYLSQWAIYPNVAIYPNKLFISMSYLSQYSYLSQWNIWDRGVKLPTHSFWGLTWEVILLSGKITLPRGTSTGLGKITSLATLGMLFSPNQSRFPLVKWFSLIRNYLPCKSSKRLRK